MAGNYTVCCDPKNVEGLSFSIFQPFWVIISPLVEALNSTARKSAGHVDLLQSAAAAAAGRLDLGLTFLGAFMGWKDGPTGSEIWEFY